MRMHFVEHWCEGGAFLLEVSFLFLLSEFSTHSHLVHLLDFTIRDVVLTRCNEVLVTRARLLLLLIAIIFTHVMSNKISFDGIIEMFVDAFG